MRAARHFARCPFLASHQQSATLLGAQTASLCSGPRLLSDFLKLLTDYRSVKAIDGDVKPITFFPFHHELRKICGIGRVVARLRDQIDE